MHTSKTKGILPDFGMQMISNFIRILVCISYFVVFFAV